ncbi:hypothetical protein [Rhizobium ruizarguesonis]|uniref:hypothetical protein n=1 Tax=Rhizobium ruizarguesonis TaxID=2081791 RepID=UPI00103861BE|nr:hypothetical protein [Rhizobium ruizarguesonis]TBB32466.1 hypothetical protein ELH47_11255 [Rhizobium ruizarguesonis]
MMWWREATVAFRPDSHHWQLLYVESLPKQVSSKQIANRGKKMLVKNIMIPAFVSFASFASNALALELKTEFSVNPNTEAGSSLPVPSKYKLKSYKVLVRDDKNDWTEEALNIGWAKWTVNSAEPTVEGGFLIKAALYNESGDRVRTVRILAVVE